MKRGVLTSIVAAGIFAVAASASATPYSVGGAIESGNAIAPPETSSGLGTMLVIRETDGPIGRMLSAGFAASTIHHTDNGDGTETTSVSVDRNAAAFALGGGFGTIVELELPMRSLGGDTSGFSLLFLSHIPNLPVAIGVIGGVETMYGRTVRNVSVDTMTVGATQSTADVQNHVLGLPVRVTIPLSHSIDVYIQLDLNLLSIQSDFFDGARSLTRYGVQLKSGGLSLVAELQSDPLSLDAATGRLEVLFGF